MGQQCRRLKPQHHKFNRSNIALSSQEDHHRLMLAHRWRIYLHNNKLRRQRSRKLWRRSHYRRFNKNKSFKSGGTTRVDECKRKRHKRLQALLGPGRVDVDRAEIGVVVAVKADQRKQQRSVQKPPHQYPPRHLRDLSEEVVVAQGVMTGERVVAKQAHSNEGQGSHNRLSNLPISAVVIDLKKFRRGSTFVDGNLINHVFV